ncbi:MAG: hypothetical protein AAFX99_13045 [Myxococcota bacterium]
MDHYDVSIVGLEPGHNPQDVVEPLAKHLNMDLWRAQKLLDNVPSVVAHGMSEQEAMDMHQTFRSLGVRVKLVSQASVRPPSNTQVLSSQQRLDVMSWISWGSDADEVLERLAQRGQHGPQVRREVMAIFKQRNQVNPSEATAHMILVGIGAVCIIVGISLLLLAMIGIPMRGLGGLRLVGIVTVAGLSALIFGIKFISSAVDRRSQWR